jgi:hypothetical protein
VARVRVCDGSMSPDPVHNRRRATVERILSSEVYSNDDTTTEESSLQRLHINPLRNATTESHSRIPAEAVALFSAEDDDEESNIDDDDDADYDCNNEMSDIETANGNRNLLTLRIQETSSRQGALPGPTRVPIPWPCSNTRSWRAYCRIQRRKLIVVPMRNRSICA